MSRTEYFNRQNAGALEDLSQDMERVFDSLLGRTVGSMLRSNGNEKYVPPLDVMENSEAFTIRVDLPGVKPEDVRIEMHDGKLSIAGSRSGVSEEDRPGYHRIERNSGAFHRAVTLPSEVDVDKIDASYEHGVLVVVLPKVAKQQPKKIQIRTN
jgi:HSP20 family protein